MVVSDAAIDQGFFSTKLTYGEGASHTGTVILTDVFPSWAVRTASAEAMGKSKQFGATQHDGVTVEVEGQSYFVGKSSMRATNALGGTRVAHENYSLSPEYKALFLGALYYIAQHHKIGGSLTIERLCLGLPIATFFSHRERVEAMATGAHEVPSPKDPSKTIKVHVKRVIVIGQPQGAAINFALQPDAKMKTRRVVVLDMGGGTFDWFFMDRMHPNFNRSGAAPLGVWSCVNAICDAIDEKFKSAPGALERINDALIEGAESFEVDGRDFAVKDYWSAAQHIIDAAVSEMEKSVGNLIEVDRFLLTGGGAALLVKSANSNNSPLHSQRRKFVIGKDPVFANVTGFHQTAQMAELVDE